MYSLPMEMRSKSLEDVLDDTHMHEPDPIEEMQGMMYTWIAAK